MLSPSQKIKKNEILQFVTTWMEPEGLTLSEISKEKDTYSMILIIWNKNKNNKQII